MACHFYIRLFQNGTFDDFDDFREYDVANGFEYFHAPSGKIRELFLRQTKFLLYWIQTGAGRRNRRKGRQDVFFCLQISHVLMMDACIP